MPITNFAKRIHCRIKPVGMDSIAIEICDIETQEHWVLLYQFREGKVTTQDEPSTSKGAKK